MRGTSLTLIGLLLVGSASSVLAKRGDRFGRVDQSQSQVQRVVIQMGSQHFRGQNTIFLKKEIKQQNTYLNLQNKQIEKVIVVAKSKHGQGHATLSIGGEYLGREVIDGSPYDFHNNDKYTFSRAVLEASNYGQEQGPWQIKLSGNIKVNKVVVFIKEKARRSRGVTLDMYGQHLKGLSTIFLKKELKNEFPGIDINQKKIKSIVLLVKTKQGAGRVSLRVGDSVTMSETVHGNPYDFQSSRSYTYDKVELHNPSYSSRGPWQVNLNGNFKIEKIVVKFK